MLSVPVTAYAQADEPVSTIPEADPTVPAQPAGNPVEWMTAQDYPATALRADSEGVVRFTLDVDATGAVGL